MTLRISGRVGRHACINGDYKLLDAQHNGHKAWKSVDSGPRFVFHTGKSRWVITDELGDGSACWAFVKGAGDTPLDTAGSWTIHNQDNSWGVDTALKVELIEPPKSVNPSQVVPQPDVRKSISFEKAQLSPRPEESLGMPAPSIASPRPDRALMHRGTMPKGNDLMQSIALAQRMPWEPTDFSTQVSQMAYMQIEEPDPGIFDAHVHLFDFFQHSEGMGELLEAMDANGVSHAAITGCPLKKNWSEFEERRAPEPFNDTDVLYYFSLTDFYLRKALEKCAPGDRARFAPLMSGFNPVDKSSPEQITMMLESHASTGWRGLGKIYLRTSEITNLLRSSRATPKIPAWDLIMTSASNEGLPVILQHNASSESTKVYKSKFEYIHEIDWCLKKHPSVKVLWVDGGVFCRGDWDGYKEELEKILTENENLYISISPETLHLGNNLPREELKSLVEDFPDRFTVGSATMGRFSANNQYTKDWSLIKEFLGGLTPPTMAKVSFSNANRFYRSKRPSGTLKMLNVEAKKNWMKSPPVMYNDELHDVEQAKVKDKVAPSTKHMPLKGMKDGKLDANAPLQEIKHVTIDTHLHMLDFLQKSSGIQCILEAMDGAGVEKAVLIGMPCCKKWSKDEPEKPLYYQDDNGECYFYSYADQMVADAWLALPDEQRKRFAPVMASFNPTDINAIDHLRRLWDKYPGLWRGIGEVMCRHDDLTMLLQEDETPVINHMAMGLIYEFCIEKDILCMVHHNADRTAERVKDKFYEYLWEVQQVLEEHPKLKLVWCHAGMSRRTFEEHHHEMIDKMISAYPNLTIDISWVVWEDVICEPNGSGMPKKCWIKVFEKHPTRFTIGSDQVGQFIGPVGHNWLKPEIIKYWTLGDCLKPETARAILYENAQRLWFGDWDMPSASSGNPVFRQIPACYKAQTLLMNEGRFYDREENF
jgi:predicted TIM-barrel fold metal-dependent hydrolase